MRLRGRRRRGGSSMCFSGCVCSYTCLRCHSSVFSTTIKQRGNSSAPQLLGSSALFSLILSLRRRGCWDLSAHPDNFGLIRRRRSDFQRFVGRSGKGGDERNISRLHVWIRGEGLEGPSASRCACGGILRPEGVWRRPGGSPGGSRGGFSRRF